jgi:hypothetical protein
LSLSLLFGCVKLPVDFRSRAFRSNQQRVENQQ